jgi:DNA-directed RNA polymerase specialized sigma24 family protein
MMHYYDDLKYEEIAEILNCPVGTVKIRLYRAKHELRALWEKYAI